MNIKKNKGVSVSQKQMQSSNGSKQAANFRRDFAELSITISEQIAHANKQELIKLVRNEQIAEKADFGRMDVNVAREMVDTIRKVKCKFPFVSLPFIGASQSMNKNLEQNIRINLMRLYVQNNPTGDINVITEMVNDATEAYMKKFAIKENDLAVAITVKRPEKITKPKPGMEIAGGITEYVGDTFASKLSGIGLNEVSAVDYAALCRKLEAEEQKGASPKGCTTVKYLIYHEIAHVLDDKLKISEDPDVIREYLIHKQMSESEQADNVCTYAGKNIYEFIAEAWAESQSSPVPGKVAQLINEKINVAANAYMKAKKGDEDYVRELER